MYTYRRFPLFDALDHVAALGLRHVEPRTGLRIDAKRPELKFSEDLPADVRKELRSRLADKGLSLTSCYPDFTTAADQPRRVFELCKEMGTSVILAEPPAEILDTLEKLCDEYKIDLALHNHQEGQSKYWSPDLVLAACRGRSKRLGGCCDLGQWARSGLDPVECLRKMDGRIIGIHLKDILKKGDRGSRNCVFGTGEATLSAGLTELRRLGYKGVVAIDYEHDTAALHQDMARNVAFVEDVARKLI
jgi:sugar phosphate isomerase/epimerase